MGIAVVLIVLVVALAALLLRRKLFGRSGLAVAIAVVSLAGVAAFGWSRRVAERTRSEIELREALPRRAEEGKFATSTSCRSCHPQEYASWHASYHRQMTQVARPDTVLGAFDGSAVEFEGQRHKMVRRGDELWVESSPAAFAKTSDDFGESKSESTREPGARRVVMTTGAHHMQLYWAAGEKGNLLNELPLVYIRDEQEGCSRWAPLEASFLSPTSHRFNLETHWNTSCLMCHSTGGMPRLDPQTGATATQVAELGIACESCHGPAEKHVEYYQNPAHRDAASAQREAEAIVNPARLTPARSAEVCGYCHAVSSFASGWLTDEWFRSGTIYRPGDDLSQLRVPLLPARLTPEQLEITRRTNALFEGSFWPDGMVRIAGREYNGLLESACSQQGGMTCLACHSMHQSEPDDQLAAGMDGNQACYQCHDSYREALTTHTHHTENSSGSLCYNCHMPHTTYGLFKGIRSHQISSPKTNVTLETGRATACNLCHLDQTLGWTAEHLANWYGQTAPQLDDDQRTIAAVVQTMLGGDRIQRVLLAYVVGRTEALEASGREWLVPHLAQLLVDPSPVIRLVSYRSLRNLGDKYAAGYDFIAPEAERELMKQRAIKQWKELSPARRRGPGERVLIDERAEPQAAVIERLLDMRDDRQIDVRE